MNNQDNYINFTELIIIYYFWNALRLDMQGGKTIIITKAPPVPTAQNCYYIPCKLQIESHFVVSVGTIQTGKQNY